jgi:chemotaxis family two-component system response regulator Rcp1
MNAPATPERVHVLVVEHKAATARMAIEALGSSTVHYEMTVVGDAAAALNHLHGSRGREGPSRPDFIVLDLELPGRSGHLVLADLKADDRLRGIPVIAFTSGGSRGDQQAPHDAHSCCYITKPKSLDEFASVVQAIEQLWLPSVARRRNGSAARASHEGE